MGILGLAELVVYLLVFLLLVIFADVRLVIGRRARTIEIIRPGIRMRGRLVIVSEGTLCPQRVHDVVVDDRADRFFRLGVDSSNFERPLICCRDGV